MFSGFLDFGIFDSLQIAFNIVYQSAFIWLPIVTGIAIFNMWVSYRRGVYWAGLGSVLLEIKLPKEIFKSPVAMEVIMGVFSQAGGEQTWIERMWKCSTRDWFSLELVSEGGKIRFFVWTRPKYKNAIESQIYSQYPGIEIYEVEDYTLPVSYNKEKNVVWGCEWKLKKADAYPIKTYVDYGLDKDPKEEFKIDPLSTMIEFMGSLTEGHRVWIQIIVRSHTKNRRWEVFSEQDDSWKDNSDKEIKKIIEKFRPEDKEKQSRQATEGEKDVISALERSLSKTPFDVGIRSLYIAEKDKFNGSNIGGMLGSFKQYSSPALNGFSPTGGLTGFNYPWQDFRGKTREFLKKHVLEAYKSRQIFYPPYKGKATFVLNSEELATIFHFPGQTVTTPTFERIPSKKSEAPANLPT